ncbi:MAG: TetR family transcriptional regulator [Actinobacteria bacterium]|nr:TetR family transcriptional regulator [Actinomycetota bacterium]
MTDVSDPSRGDAARARLIAAAVDAFAEKGFHGTTTRDIASGAGMSPAALYVHHRSKEEMLYLIARDGHAETLALVHASMADADGSTETLRRVVHALAAQHARGHTVARIINYELAALEPEHQAEIRALRHEIQQTVRDLIAQGVEAGEFEVADADLTAAAILSLCIDLARWYTEGGRWTPQLVGDHYAALALRMVGATVTP